ncbi:MAG: preprotein translocase subunit SecG [Desulfobacterales bacterium]|nr:preprotein translocase subunit SecG [Desulfobacterales bacterium]
METILIIIHVAVCVFLVAIVLLQQGKGADVGATFGGGGGESLFGSEGPVPLMNKITTAAAVIFMMTSISLAYLSANRSTGSVMSGFAPTAVPMSTQAPAQPALPPAEIPSDSGGKTAE